MNCKFCKKEIKQPEGKRTKEYCNTTCRSNFWYAENIKGKIKKSKPAPKVKEIKNEAPADPKPTFKSNFEKIMWEAQQQISTKK